MSAPARPAALLLLLAGAALATEPFVQPRDADGRFQNLDRKEPRGFGGFLRWQWDRLMGRSTRAPARAPVPQVTPDFARLQTPPGPGEGVRLTWVGHATWLVQLDGMSFLTDPVLGDSIPGFISRNVPPAIPWERLPHIDAALVSHNHYDHLDLPTLRRLGVRVVAGLGTDRILRREKLLTTELAWWQSTEVGGVRVTFVPAQHFSQRGLADRNEALWGGFVVEGPSGAVYHSGDTAMFEGFREIGRRFRIDAALLPIGAYDPRWFMEAVHVDPEQAVQAFEQLGARTLLAMHWGTFKLSDEPLDEPPRRLEAERIRRGLPPEAVRAPAIGETVEVRRPREAATAGSASALAPQAQQAAEAAPTAAVQPPPEAAPAPAEPVPAPAPGPSAEPQPGATSPSGEQQR